MKPPYYKRYCVKAVTVTPTCQLRHREIEYMMREAVRISGQGTDIISFRADTDLLSLLYAFGTGASILEGMGRWDLLEGLFVLGEDPKLRVLDLVRIGPLRDFRDATIQMPSGVILTFPRGYPLRKTRSRGN